MRRMGIVGTTTLIIRNDGLELPTPLVLDRIRDPGKPGVGGQIQQSAVPISRERCRIFLVVAVPIRTARRGEMDNVLTVAEPLRRWRCTCHRGPGTGPVVKRIRGILRMHTGGHTELIAISCCSSRIVDSAGEPIGVACDDEFAHEQDGSMELVGVREQQRAVEDGWVERLSDVGDGGSVGVREPGLHQGCEAGVIGYERAGEDDALVDLMACHDLDVLIKRP